MIACCRRNKIDGQIARRLVNRRLAYYGKSASAEGWDSHWRDNPLDVSFYEHFAKGEVGAFGRLMASVLPREGKILEAGCGRGQYVLGLLALGFDCEGIDYAAETVATVKAIFPDLPLRVGDVTAIDAPDGYYSGYISLGVIEHFQEGPDAALAEAFRVLRPGGVAVISVPWFNALRQLKAKIGFYRGDIGELSFYQYAYTAEEMTEILQRNGFHVDVCHGYDCFKGLKDELPFVAFLADLPRLGWRLQRMLRTSVFLNRYAGHVAVFVCYR